MRDVIRDLAADMDKVNAASVKGAVANADAGSSSPTPGSAETNGA